MSGYPMPVSAGVIPAAKPTVREERQRILDRLTSLRMQRATWEPAWRELATYVSPRRTRFFQSEATTAGVKKNQQIINGAATEALRTLASGLMAGITSPARPWFRLTVSGLAPAAPNDVAKRRAIQKAGGVGRSIPFPDRQDNLADDPAVQGWLHDVESRLLDAFARSNIYNALHTVYSDLSLFGTAVMLVEEDTEDPLRAYALPAGEYFLAQSDRGVIDTLYHETSYSVRALVKKFGLEACSREVRDLYTRKEFDKLIEVLHVVEPREDFDPEKLDGKNRPWASYWLEKSSGDATTGFLRESGYHECPILAPRWAVTGVDVYGSSPGMDALGDCKALQLYESSKSRAAEMIVDPPLGAPGSLRNRGGVSLLPGEVTYLDGAAGSHRVEPLVVVPPAAVTVMGGEIAAVERRIRSYFFADLWLMLSQEEAGQPITAREVQERHEEKMLQLGPVMERLEDELLQPLIERGLGIIARSGHLPPPPDVLRGKDIQPEFLSIMAQAQKMIAGSSISQLMQFVQGLAQVKPDIIDKVNVDAAVAKYGDALAVDPTLIVSDDKVTALRQARMKQQQQQAAAQNAAQAAQAAQTLSKTDLGSDNVLSRTLGGVAAAQANPGTGSVQ